MIYDGFFFFNELDVLEIRLATLYDHVDKFILVEDTHTIAGNPKPFYYEENKERYATWSDKISYVKISEMTKLRDHVSRERRMRECIVMGIKDIKDDDVIIISDADEIPSPEAVKQYKPEMGLCCPEQINCYYWINCVGGGWAATRFCPGSLIKQVGTHAPRQDCGPQTLIAKGNGGWHFSYLGQATGIKSKLESFLHQDKNLPNYKDPVWLNAAVNVPLDLFRRDGHDYHFVPLDDRFPKYVVDNKEKFSYLWRDAKFNERLISDKQLCLLFDSARWRNPGMDGIVVDLGVWEGRSTIALAHAVYPSTVYAVDTWKGSISEGEVHCTVQLASERDIHAQFTKNINSLSQGNIFSVKSTTVDFLKNNTSPIRFAHIDASHDYDSVKEEIELIKPKVPIGGVICGDDFESASADRSDLKGGVERAVRECLPGFEHICGNFWLWQKK